MLSTGEVACFGHTKEEAYIKGICATGFVLPSKKVLLSLEDNTHLHEFEAAAAALCDLGLTVYGTRGTSGN